MHRVGMERIRIEILKGGDRYKTALTPAASAILAKETDGLQGRSTRPVALDAGANMGWLPLLSLKKNGEFCALETDVVKAVELCKTLAQHHGCASGKGRGQHARRAPPGVAQKIVPSQSLNRTAREKGGGELG